MQTQTVVLNVAPGGVPPIVYATQNDNGRTVHISVIDGASGYSLSDSYTYVICGTKPSGTGFSYDDKVTKIGSSMLSFDVNTVMTAVAGPVRCGIIIYDGDQHVETLAFILQVQESALSPETIIDSNDFQSIIESAVRDYIEEAGLVVDDQLETPGAAADAKKTGDEIRELKSLLWYGREGDNTYLRPWVAYDVTNLSTFSVVTDMPSSSFTFSAASKFVDSLGPGFTWELTDTTTFVIEKWRRGRDAGDFQYRIRSLGGLKEYVGYAPSASPSSITWNDVSYVELYAGRDEATNKLRTVSYFTGSISTPADLPFMSYKSATGSAMQDILGEDFEDTLTSTSTYILFGFSKDTGRNNDMFTLMSIGGISKWVGYINSGGTITWNNVSFSEVARVSQEVETLLNLAKPFYHEEFRPGDFILFTDIAAYPDGWWGAGGAHGSNTYTRTEFLPVYPGETYYITNKPNNGTIGVFYDADGNFASRLLKDDVVLVPYQKANGYTQSTSNYLGDTPTSGDCSGIFKFEVPDGCYSVSFNINSGQLWHVTMSTKPIFMVNSFWENNRALAQKVMNRDQTITDEEWAARVKGANVVIPKNDQAYQEYGQRKLCVIGPSTCMIDRRNPNKNGMTQYIAGWQEYMMPYYGEVASYGYSGASWGDGYVYDGTYHSIHTMICGNEDLGIAGVDLSGYDDFVLMGSVNGITTTGAGDWDTSTPDTDTYLGALRATIEYIYAANDKARVWVFNVGRAAASDANVPIIEAINAALPNMCMKLSLNPVNYATVGFNQWTRDDAAGGEKGWTYDGTHYNQTGSKMLGQYMRHMIIGR